MIAYPRGDQLQRWLEDARPGSLDFVVLATGAGWSPDQGRQWQCCLDAAVRALKSGGLLFVQGVPETLPDLGVYLDGRLRFKYWIAIESAPRVSDSGLPSVHAAVLMFAKGETFHLSRVRFPHRYCRACGKPLRDWGGKTHLMHPDGVAISDVWKDLPLEDNYFGISAPVLETLLHLVSPTGAPDAAALNGIVGPAERVAGAGCTRLAEPLPRYRPLPLPGLLTTPARAQRGRENALFDVVIEGDAVEVLRRYPDESVDLVFADPPYNLDKAYMVYNDERDARAYLDWCNAWLNEYVRILKPTGSLYLLNLPRWGMHHAAYLNRRLFFQNWIVWDALSEPRGKMMPAHYALLFYTKHPSDFTFNYDEVGSIDARAYCLRSSCIRQRKARGDDEKEPLSDIWWDVHRIKHRRDRDYHPCQLPDALMERIIRLSTNPGDVVLDALAGTGTTAVVAAKLGRRYVAIDIDPTYAAITRNKLAQVEMFGEVRRQPVARPRPRYSKKDLQLELRAIALRLGRLPTPEDVQAGSRYGLQPFLEAFPTWGKALKAAKLLEAENDYPRA